jgi:hypothetical protein
METGGTGPATGLALISQTSDPPFFLLLLFSFDELIGDIPLECKYLLRSIEDSCSTTTILQFRCSVKVSFPYACSFAPELSLSVLHFDPLWNPRRSDMMAWMCRPYLFNTTAFSDRSIHFWNLRSITVGSKCCRTSCFLSNRVRSMKCVYFAHALAYRSVCAMNTPYDPSLGMLPDKSGKLTILKGKSSRLSYREVTIS